MFYLKYHLYRQYFPLIALTTYAKVMAEKRQLSAIAISRQVMHIQNDPIGQRLGFQHGLLCGLMP